MADRPGRVVIAEDSVLLRDGLQRLLAEAGFDVVASLGDAHDLSEIVTETEPDLVLVDVRMPPTFTDEGIRAALAIRAARPTQPIMVLSQYVEETYAVDLLTGDAAGIGYLLKDRVVDIADFLDAVRRVAAGGSAIDPDVVRQLLGRSRRTVELGRLTSRERDVLAAMAEGLSNAGIAQRLTVSVGAVEKHISNVFTKLDLEPESTTHRRVLAVTAFMGSSAD